MIKKIHIENYKCYKKSSLSFKDVTVIVGSNNAGKSTLIEALRLVSYAASKYLSVNYSELPTYFGLPKVVKGFKINASNLMIDLRSSLYQLEGTYAKIDVEFESKEHIVIYLDTEMAYACIQDKDKNYISSKSQAKHLNLSAVKIMPQLGLIKEEEKLISAETIEKGVNTRLASRHFRNELLHYKRESYQIFKEMAEETWDGLRIQELTKPYGDESISLLVYDGSFSSEIGNMGSGLQMWLQIIWFLSRCSETDTIILDEPDVYMHPDMQRKVFDIVINKYKQVIVATHSVEIISDVDPRNIVTIDRTSREFSYANNIKGAQSIIDSIGSVHNLSLIRLATAKRCLFVEGNDMTLLTKIHNKLYPKERGKLKTIPTISLGGKARFEETFGAAKLLHAETDDQIQVICLLDRDYSFDEEIEQYQSKAKDSGLTLHIWSKKEIENYIVTPEIIFKASKLPSSEKPEFLLGLDSVAQTFYDNVFDSYAQKHSEINRGKEAKNHNEAARTYLQSKWRTLNEKMSLICGKDLKKAVFAFLQEKYKISLRESDLINAITKDNVDQEMIHVLSLLTQ